ncbi:hypothetical protein PIB30_108324, partial [Stylosanthes scabra]|nr:hypothetical protein [Stylosanthes scabra]
MVQVRAAAKSFASLLLSLMNTAHWDIPTAVRSIEAATATASNKCDDNTSSSTINIVSPQHANLSTLLNPDQFRRDCFAQYRDMKSMDPAELLGILPACHFGRFCSDK